MNELMITIYFLATLTFLSNLNARSNVTILTLQPSDIEFRWISFKANFSKTFQNKTHESKWYLIKIFI